MSMIARHRFQHLRLLMVFLGMLSYLAAKSTWASDTMQHEPITLGETLAPREPKSPGFSFGRWLRNTLYTILTVSLLTVVSAFALWWFFMRPIVDWGIILAVAAVLFVFWLIIYRGARPTAPQDAKPCDLLANDHKGFMRHLRLDKKTVIIDGSNIYHFGHEHGLGAQPLVEIARQLRAQGYRIVCFFDANIFYTLIEHGVFPNLKTHTMALLYETFRQTPDEIYVVPSGVQADRYVLESLKHLPISFAVTNDQFRDYAKEYPTVMKDQFWRKGVVISNNEIKLLQHQLQTPILIESVGHDRKQLKRFA